MTRKKAVVFFIVLLVGAVVVVEAGLHLFYLVLEHHVFPFREYEAEIQLLAAPADSAGGADLRVIAGEHLPRQEIFEVIHPYLGYVRDPERTADTSYLGFAQKGDDPLAPRRDGTLTVAIFGGSFAEGISHRGRAVLQARLRTHGLETRVVNLGQGGFKQPQQFFTLAWLLTHGAPIDVVLNVDGFNEVALPEPENVPKGVNPFYPRAWYQRTFALQDPAMLRRIGSVMARQDDRRRWAAAFRPLPSFSIIRNVAWVTRDRMLEREIETMTEEVRRMLPSPDSRRFITNGPDLGTNPANLYDRIAEHWRASSVLMKGLCESQRIVYVHALQPNQYFAASKTLTDEERRIAFSERHPYRPGVVAGYPRLVAVGRTLRDQGVDFHDLTMIYRGIGQSIWADACCHPNQRGYDMIAEYLADTIARAVKARRRP